MGYVFLTQGLSRPSFSGLDLMESINSESSEPQVKFQDEDNVESNFQEAWLAEKFETILPKIQEKWPDLAKNTLEATKGSLDELINVISVHTGKTSNGVKAQLQELLNTASDKTKDLAESLEPLEKQLEDLLDDLNQTIRPRIEKPIRKRPLLAIGMATSIGVILGIILASGGKQSR